MEFLILSLAYFVTVFSLSKISERLQIENDSTSFLLSFVPPLYLLYLTGHFTFMFLLLLAAYSISYLTFSFDLHILVSLIPVYLVLCFAATLISSKLKASQSTLLMLLFPGFGLFFLIFYLAFFQWKDQGYSLSDVAKEEEKILESVKRKKRARITLSNKWIISDDLEVLNSDSMRWSYYKH